VTSFEGKNAIEIVEREYKTGLHSTCGNQQRSLRQQSNKFGEIYQIEKSE
jgi:hypothetical protein